MTTEAEPFPDNWIYLHDPGTRAGRVQNFGAWSPDMVKPGTTCLGVEYFCFEGDDIWEMPDEDAVELATRRAGRIGLIDPAKVVDGVKVRVPKAYPMYDGDYREAVAVIRGYLEPASRTCRPSAATGCTATTTRITRCGRRSWRRSTSSTAPTHDVWSVNTEAEYHEEGEDRRRAPRRRARWLRPTLSIVVGSNGAPGSVEACLAALAGQVDGAEVIVCEPSASPRELQGRFPFARFLERAARSCRRCGVTASTLRRGRRWH